MHAYNPKETRLNIQQYITSGVIETYVMGLASPEEASQLERLLPFYPDLQAAISDFGFQLELFSIQHEEPPPPGTFQKIRDRVRELPAVKSPPIREKTRNARQEREYLHVQDSSTHIRVHKYWRVVFIAVFILSKLLLFGFIYYLLQFRHAQRDLRALEDQQVRSNKAQLSADPQDNDK
jgi:hypothetical protein